jgi:hypothetical protein
MHFSGAGVAPIQYCGDSVAQRVISDLPIRVNR